jgi:hypothetical protein
MVLTLELSGMFDLKPMRTFPLGPQTWLVNPVIDQRAPGYCIPKDIQKQIDAE